MVAFAERDTSTEVRCQCCGVVHSIMYNRQDMVEWMCGQGFIQDLMGYLSDAERELLISGICGSCFDQMFPKEELDFTK